MFDKMLDMFDGFDVDKLKDVVETVWEDRDKIQELGTFLEHTGAQYIVSMPTSADIRRAGSWLQGVLTCTLTRGGFDSQGELRLAPAVKCSYVVRDGE